MRIHFHKTAAAALLLLWGGASSAQTNGPGLLPAQDYPRSWDREFPIADFSRSTIDFDEVLSGGPPRDGIPAIDSPVFVTVEEASERCTPSEPVIGLSVNGEAKAYPLQVLTWHEIANDTVGGVPVALLVCGGYDTDQEAHFKQAEANEAAGWGRGRKGEAYLLQAGRAEQRDGGLGAAGRGPPS